MPYPHELAKVPGAGEVGETERFCVHAQYDFAKQGGAVGNINLLGDTALPDGALVVDAHINVLTPPTSGGAATIALKVEGAGDIQAAAAYNGAPYSTAGRKAVTKTAATAPIECTAKRDVVMTIATAALTDGKFDVLIFYYAPGL